jgi:hypothetical protein
MLKRVALIGVLAVALFTMRGSEARAHLAGYTYSPTYRHIASYDCTGNFAQIPNLDQHPALFECFATVRAFQVVCQNPQKKIVTPGIPSGPRTVVQSASTFISATDLEKERGRVTETVLLPETVLTAGDAMCRERNRKWTAADELVQVVDVELRTFDCGDDINCVNAQQAFGALLRCTVPPQYSLPDNPPPGGGVPTPYDCTLLAEGHCDDGEDCDFDEVPYP